MKKSLVDLRAFAALPFLTAIPLAAQPVLPVVSISPARTLEGNSGTQSVLVPVHLSAAAPAAVSATWTTVAGSAHAGSDFTAGSGTVTFAPGETYQTISVEVKGDAAGETDEAFSVVLSGPQGGALGASEARVLIQNDEPVTTLHLPSNPQVFERFLPGSQTFTASVGNPQPGKMAALSLTSGTATAGSDVSLAASALSLSSAAAVLPLRGLDDSLAETEETFTLHVTSADAAVRMIPGNRLRKLPVGPHPSGMALEGDLLAAADGTGIRVFRKAGGTWAQEAIISAAAEGGVKSVALDQGVIAADFLGTGVKIFAYIGGEWTLQATIPRITSEADDRRRVALSDDTLAVSDPAVAGQATSGEIRVYERHRGGRDAWGLRQVLTPPGTKPEFGTSVAIWGDFIAATSRAPSSAGIYRRTAATGAWSAVKEMNYLSISNTDDGCVINGGRFLVSINNSLYMSRRVDSGGLAWTDLSNTAVNVGSAAGIALTGDILAGLSSSGAVSILPVSASGSLGQGGAVRPEDTNDTYLPEAFAFDGATLAIPVAGSADAWSLVFYEPLTAVAGTVVDDESVSFSITGIAREEGTGTAVTVQLSRPLPAPVSVLCTTVDGTATSAEDYQWNSAWVTFSPGITTATFSVDTFADGLAEGPESFGVALEFPSVGSAGPPAVITLTDAPPAGISLSASSHAVVEGNSGLTPLTVTAILTKPAGPGSSFQWELVSNTATAGTDFPVPGGTVTVPAGASSVEFQVAVNGDDICEPVETLTLRLSGSVNLEIRPSSTAVITITNDDSGTPAPDSYTVAQNGVLSGVNVRDNDCSALPVAVAQTTARGTLVLNSSGAFVYTPHANFIGTDSFSYGGTGGGGGGGDLAGTDLVDSSSVFRWFNPLNGIDPHSVDASWNTGWYLPDWNDAGWGEGSGLMGYGQMISSQGSLNPDTDIGTPVSGMRRTAYFRHQFNVAQQGIYDLDLSISRDDAAIVYINGSEVVRSHEAGAVNIRTAPDTWDLMIEGNAQAWTAASNEGDPYVHRLTGVSLNAGLNTLAISGHNSMNPSAPTSSDLGIRVFYLRVVSGGGPPPVATPVTIQVTDDHKVPVLAPDTYSVTEDQVLNTAQSSAIPVFGNDGLFDSGGAAYDPVLEAGVQDVTNGTVSAWNPFTGHFVFTPSTDFNGVASFRYRVRDKDGWSQPALVTINVTGDLTLGAMTRMNPPGSQLFRSDTGMTFPSAGVADAAVSLRAGQTLSLRAAISGALGKLEVRSPGGAALPGGISDINSLQNVPIPADGVYIVAGGPVTGGTGAGVFTLLVNGGLPGQPDNWFLPLPLESSRPAGSPRAAVSATMSASNPVPHYYGITGSAGETVHLYLHAGAAMGFSLQNASGAALATSTVSTHAGAAAFLNHTFAASGNYRVSIPAVHGADYSLQLYRGGHTHEYAAAAEPPATEVSAGHLQGPGGTDAGVTFAAFGDYGSGSSNEAAVAGMVKSWSPDFIVAVGDHNYTNDVGVGASSWSSVIGNFYGEYILGRDDNYYPEQTSPVQRFFPVPGNHDSGPNSANGGELSGYFDYFHSNPGGALRLPPGVFEPMLTYYKMQWGNMEFYFIDSDNGVINPDAAAAQRQWMRSQLDASTARWKFAVWHHPPYSSSAVHGNHPVMQWGEDFQGLTAIITGHDHIYERLDAGYGVTQFITGLGGQSIYPFSSAVPQSLFRYNSAFGAMKVRAGSDGVRFEFRAAGSPGGDLIDSYSIGNPPGEAVPAGDDTWSLRVQPGQILRIATRTPAVPGSLVNTADPALEVRDTAGSLVAGDTGSAEDGLNASLLVRVPDIPGCPPEGCLWTVRVYNQGGGGGEYELDVTAPPAAEYYDLWASARLPEGTRGSAQDPDHDGAPNLMEFLASTDPAAAGGLLPLSISQSGVGGVQNVQINLPADWIRPVTVRLERSPTMAPGSWRTMASKSPGAPWVSSGLPDIPRPVPGGGFLFTDAAGPQGFYRLQFVTGP